MPAWIFEKTAARRRPFCHSWLILPPLVRRVIPDKVLPELRPYGGKILRTSLSTEQEKRLKAAIEEMGSAAVTA
jgi:uncharacterized membrane protein